MRILAIRGSNLASLPEFAIDFTAEPLSRSGLFAITGQTGAGKSTILDALCVALFDKTPRLSDRGGALIGRPDEDDSLKLASNDVRSLLRRGTGSGSAEVDFVGRDGRSYRASWQVRRARNAPTGKFQPQESTLFDLETGQPLGGRKTETLELIQEKLGLTYDQFRRSVLLAQGEFAVFLRADGKERAELLEKITGTDIYAKLSQAAFRRMRDEEGTLGGLERQLGDVTILGEEERSARETQCSRVTADLNAARDAQAALERAEAWYRLRDELGNAVTEAETNLAAAQCDWDGVKELRRQLAEAEEAERFSPTVLDVDRTRSDVATLAERESGLVTAVISADQEIARLRQILQEAESSANEAQRQIEEAKPLLDKARALDSRIADANKLLTEEKKQLAEVKKEESSAIADRDAIAGGINDNRHAVATADAWLAEQCHIMPVAAEWGRWRQELERSIAAHRRLQELSGAMGGATAANTESEAGLTAARVMLENAESEAAEKKEAVTAAELAVQGLDLTLARRQRQEQEERLAAAHRLRQAAEQAEVVAKERSEANDQAGKAREEQVEAAERLRVIEEERSRTTITLAEADRALTLARASLDLAGQRSELRDDEPCPLCGSQKHPYVTAGAPAESVVAAQKSRVHELQEAITALEHERGGIAAQCEAKKRDEVRERELAAACGERLQRLQSAWEIERGRLVDTLVPDAAVAKEAVPVALRLTEEVTRLLETLKSCEKKGTELLQAVGPAREAFDQAQQARDGARAAVKAAEDLSRETVDLVEKLSTEQAHEQQRLSEVTGQLEPPFAGWGGWLDRLAADPSLFSSECDMLVREWQSFEGRKLKASEAVAEASAKLEAVNGRLQAIAGNLSLREAACLQREQSVHELTRERLNLWEGRPVADIERELDEAAASARTRLAGTAKALGEAETSKALLTGKRDEAVANRQVAEEAQSRAINKLNDVISATGRAEDTLRSLIALGEEWRREAREKLAGIDGGLRDAGTVLEERRKGLAQHEGSAQPEMTAEAIPTAREEVAAGASALEQEWFSLKHQLEADAEARAKAMALLPAIEAQRRQTLLWQGMNELIGSADGKKFRGFAQSLTLDLLLSLANEHLQSLAPRFAIMRVPSSEMDMQMVDRDMGDDIRSVNNISGGESFLVSLALALGLSSLASGTTRIGSLFIDEGFGSLDQETLDVALSTLDALQASGRMIGVISHVAGLTERIGTRIEVKPYGGGRSRVQVKGVV